MDHISVPAADWPVQPCKPDFQEQEFEATEALHIGSHKYFRQSLIDSLHECHAIRRCEPFVLTLQSQSRRAKSVYEIRCAFEAQQADPSESGGLCWDIAE
jgi:hypothetical protein